MLTLSSAQPDVRSSDVMDQPLVRSGFRTNAFVSDCDDASRFARTFGDDQVFAPRIDRFPEAGNAGRLTTLSSAPKHGVLVGVAASWLCEDDEDLAEIGPVVIRPDFRRLGLATILAQALAVQECAETQSFSGVVVVTREDNLAGRQAIRALGAPLHCPAEMIRCNPCAERFVEAAQTRMAPAKATLLYSMVTHATFQTGAQMLLAARSAEGFLLKNGATLRLGAGWYRYDEGFWAQVELIALGWMPGTTPPRTRGRLTA